MGVRKIVTFLQPCGRCLKFFWVNKSFEGKKEIMAFYLLQFLDLRKQSALSFLNFGCDIGIILIFGLHLLYVVNRKWENRLNLRPWTIIKKTHGTLFSLIFEVWEKKVPLIFFSDLTQILRYSHFLNSWTAPYFKWSTKDEKMTKSQPLSQNWQN